MYSSEEDAWARDYDCTMWFECTIVTDVVGDGTDIYEEQIPDFDNFFYDLCDGFWLEKGAVANKGEKVIITGDFKKNVYVEDADEKGAENSVFAEVEEAFQKHLPNCSIEMYRTW